MSVLVILVSTAFLINGNCDPASETAISESYLNSRQPDITMMEGYERYHSEPNFMHFPMRDA